jgi:SAM-dependent methyltransferase
MTSSSGLPPIHQHALAYLLGLEGVALLRAFAGEHDRDFTQARFREIRELLDRADELGAGTDLEVMSAARAYDGWAATYDGEENGLFPLQDPVLLPILDELVPGVAIDAACGTGRTSRELLRRGHQVLGFDLSPRMLACARGNVPEVTLAEASYTCLPVRDGSADHLVCTLALSHLDDLGSFFAEAARVLRRGGHLVISDTRGHFFGSSLNPLLERDVDGNVGYLPNWWHSTGDYVRAALGHGFDVLACEDVRRPGPTVEPDELPEPLAPTRPPDIWALHPWVAEAANAARAGLSALVVWHFQLRE